LHGAVLEKSREGIEADGSCDVNSPPIHIAVAAENPELVEAYRGGWRRGHDGGQRLAWGFKVKIAGPKSNFSQPVAEKNVTGIDLAALWVVLQVPLDVRAGPNVLRTNTRDQGRCVPGLRQKRDASKLHRCREDIALSGDERTPKVWIEEIFLRQLPSDNFSGLWHCRAAQDRIRVLVFLAGTAKIDVFIGYSRKRRDPRCEPTRVQLCRFTLGVQPVHDTVLQLVGVT